MTWTKLGTEFNSECALAGLSDAAYRTHAEAIGFLYEVEAVSCRIPKRLLGRFAGSDDAGAAIEQLTAIGYWKDAGAVWVVLHHADVIRQSIAAQQDKRSRDKRAQAAARRRKSRGKVSADVSADGGTESASTSALTSVPTQSDRQTVGSENHGALENQGQSRAGGQSRVGDPIADKTGSGLDRSAANSHNPRVHHGPDDPTPDVQQSRIPVTHQSQAADRNARTRGAS